MSPPPGGQPRIWTIGELNRRADRAVVLEFRGPVWVTGELASVRESANSRWFELVQRGGGRDGRDAHLEARCSATKWRRLAETLDEAGVGLRTGQSLVASGCLEVGDRGKLTLAIDDINIAALVGDRLRARRQVVQRLVEEGRFDVNRGLPLPRLPLRVGLVTSAGTDGHRDVVRRLEGSGFAFAITLRSVPVEGPQAPRAIAAALAGFGPADVDVALLVRGGGAKAALDVFDQDLVAEAVASSLVPVWTGIGHTQDRTVADELAHRCCPTPSAAGHELVVRVAEAWEEVVKAVAGIGRAVEIRLVAASDRLAGHRREVAGLARSHVARHEDRRARLAADLARSAGHCLDVRAADLAMAAHAIGTSGRAEVRHAGRQLAGLAAETTQAARHACVDAAADVAVAGAGLSRGADEVLSRAEASIGRTVDQLPAARLHRLLGTESARLGDAAVRIGRGARRRLDDHAARAASNHQLLDAYDPRRQLARGWTLTHTVDGTLVRHIIDVAEGEGLVTTFADGVVTSTVTGITASDG
jgi:exodeoxyribonuclease VII large subunit